MTDQTHDDVSVQDAVLDLPAPGIRRGNAARGFLLAVLLSCPAWIGLALAVRWLAVRGGA